MDQIRQQMDELMGKNRNMHVNDKARKQEHFDDDDVCKYYLVSFCPHPLFPNTKQDLGPCMKRHDEHFKLNYLKEQNRIQYEKKYIKEYLNLIDSLITQINSKIKRTQQKLDQNQLIEVDMPRDIMEKLHGFDQEIKKLLTLSERLGEQGKLEEAENIMIEIEQIKSRKEDLQKSQESQNANAKSMKVCEICGALQAVNDTINRVQLHLEGKLHTGFDILRKEQDKLSDRLDTIQLQEKRMKENKKVSRSRSKKRSASRDRKQSRRRSRSNSRDLKRRDNHKSSKYKKYGRYSRSRSDSRNRKHKKSHKRDSSRDRNDSYKSENDQKKKSRFRSRSKSANNQDSKPDTQNGVNE